MGKNGEIWSEDLWKWLYILPESGQKSLGQSFLKDCGCREGKALRLHGKPILANFSRLKSVPVLVVAVRRPKILSKKKKLPYRECFKGATSLAGLPRTPLPSALRISEKSEKGAIFKSFRSTRAL